MEVLYCLYFVAGGVVVSWIMIAFTTVQSYRSSVISQAEEQLKHQERLERLMEILDQEQQA